MSASELPRPVPRRRFLGLTGAVAAAPALAAAWPAPAAAATVVYVSQDFGFDPVDSTSYLQQALDSGADVVVIDYPEGYGPDNPPTWITGPLWITKAVPQLGIPEHGRDNFEIRLLRNVTLRAKAQAFPGLNDSLLTIRERTGVTIYGPQATLRMNKPEYTSGEWRMGVQLLSASNILIDGVTVRDTGGDGIYVGAVQPDQFPTEPPYCQTVIVRNVTCVGAKRNGIGVVSANVLRIVGCDLRSTIGTNPEAGIDFEPDKPEHRLTDIIMMDCLVTGNRRSNVLVVLKFLDSTSAPVSILLARIRFGGRGNTDTPNFRVVGVGPSDPGGTVELRNSFIHAAPYAGAAGVVLNKAYNGVQVHFSRVTFYSWDTGLGQFGPIAIGPSHGTDSVPEYGNILWTECTVATNVENPFLHPFLEDYGDPPDCSGGVGMANLQGDLTAINPTGTPEPGYGDCGHDIGLAVSKETVMPAQTVTVTANPTSVPAGEEALLRFHRTAPDLSDSLAVLYAVSGTAAQRYDYEGLARVAVIPGGTSYVNIPLRTRRPDGQPGTRTATVTIQQASTYAIGSPNSATVNITG